MATIDARKGRDGKLYWRARVRLKGQPPQTRSFDRKTDAVRWAEKMQTEIRDGRLSPREIRRHTLKELIKEYRGRLERGALPRKRRYSTSEQAKRGKKLDWWSKRLGAYYLPEITARRIDEALSDLEECGPGGRPVSPATQVRYLALLGHVFQLGVKLEWLVDNPVRTVDRPTEPRGRMRFLDHDERGRLLNACRMSPNPQLYSLVILALATGARQGELLRLHPAHLDMERGIAVLHETKNGQRRALPLSSPAILAVNEMLGVHHPGSDLLFADHTGRARFPRGAWEAAVRSAKLEDFKFHDLRHTFASYLAMSGATLPELAAALGHKTLAMVQRYAHLSEQHTSNVVNRMAERFLNLQPSASETAARSW